MKNVRILVSVLCACFVYVAWGQQQASNTQNNWTEFHRTNMIRWNPYEKVLNARNASHLTLKWSYATGSGGNPSPAVVNGVVYIGSADNNLYALSASTGAKLWTFTTGNAVSSSPAVAKGVV